MGKLRGGCACRSPMSLLPCSGMTPGHVTDTNPALPRTGQGWCCLCYGVPSSQLGLLLEAHLLFCLPRTSSSFLAHLLYRCIRAQNELWHWAVQSVQFSAWCTPQSHSLKLLCDCRDHLLCSWTMGHFHRPVWRGSFWEVRGCWPCMSNPCSTHWPWRQREAPSLLFCFVLFSQIYLPSFYFPLKY